MEKHVLFWDEAIDQLSDELNKIDNLKKFCIDNDLHYEKVISIKNKRVKDGLLSDFIAKLLVILLNLEIDKKTIAYYVIKK